jgi:hypothetical protein
LTRDAFDGLPVVIQYLDQDRLLGARKVGQVEGTAARDDASGALRHLAHLGLGAPVDVAAQGRRGGDVGGTDRERGKHNGRNGDPQADRHATYSFGSRSE